MLIMDRGVLVNKPIRSMDMGIIHSTVSLSQEFVLSVGL